MDSNNLQIAKVFYKLAIEAQPKAFWLHLSLARCLTRMGDKKEAINELRQACEFGLSAQALADIPKQMPELSSLINDPEIQKFISDKSNK
jgi:predicted Zn-dependent protease